MLHPRKHLSRIGRQSVFGFRNGGCIQEFLTSEFYISFMKKYDYTDEMVVNFTYQGRLLGTLGLVRTRKDQPFGDQDVRIFEVMARFISHKLHSLAEFEKLDYQKRILEAHTNQQTEGLMILDSSYNILYTNRAALDLASELVNKPKKNSLEELIEKVVPSGKVSTRIGFNQTLISPSFKAYDLQWEYVRNIDSCFHTCFYVLRIEKKKTSISPQHIGLDLTERERDICLLIQKGHSNAEIGDKLFITLNTVKRHIQNIFQKARVKSRTELLHRLRDNG